MEERKLQAPLEKRERIEGRHDKRIHAGRNQRIIPGIAARMDQAHTVRNQFKHKSTGHGRMGWPVQK